MVDHQRRILVAVISAILVLNEKTNGQNIVQSSNQISQSSNINSENTNVNIIRNDQHINPQVNLRSSTINAGQLNGSPSYARLQQGNLQQLTNISPYQGVPTSSSVSEQSSTIISSTPNANIRNIQAANVANSYGQQVSNINQNSAAAISAQSGSIQNNGQSISTSSNQISVTGNRNAQSGQPLQLNGYPFNGNFEIPLNLEVSLPPVGVAVSDLIEPSTPLTSTNAAQSAGYNANPYGSYLSLPIPYTCGSRSGLRDLLPLLLLSLFNNNGRCGSGGVSGGCGGCGRCSNCIPVPVPIPIPFNPVFDEEDEVFLVGPQKEIKKKQILKKSSEEKLKKAKTKEINEVEIIA